MSDSYDDDDDFFDNPETLQLLEQAEQKAVQASQAPPRSDIPQGDRNRVLLGAQGNRGFQHGFTTSSRPPQPQLPPQPQAGPSRFPRAPPPKPAYQPPPPQRQTRDDTPPRDVVLDQTGRYALHQGSSQEPVITDNRRVQTWALQDRISTTSVGGGRSREGSALPLSQSEQARDNRRRAIAEALGGAAPAASQSFNPSQSRVLSRSNSSSSIPPRPAANGQPGGFNPNPNRQLSRSISTGSQSFGRPSQQGQGQGQVVRMPTIPSGSQPRAPSPAGPGPDAQMQKQLQELQAQFQAAQNELQALKKAQAQTPDANAGPSRAGAGTSGVGGEDLKDKMKQLQADFYRAKGEAEIMRRAQKEANAKHLAELETLKQSLADKEAQMKEKEKNQSRLVESIKHQAVFSNHALQNSAIKPRPSQRLPTQHSGFPHPAGPSTHNQAFSRGVLPTPVRNGSPSHHRTPFHLGANGDETPIALGRRGQGGMAPPTTLLRHPQTQARQGVQPGTGGFYNAFAATPTIQPRKKLKTSHPASEGSGSQTPVAQLSRRTHGVTGSPSKSPASSPTKRTQIALRSKGTSQTTKSKGKGKEREMASSPFRSSPPSASTRRGSSPGMEVDGEGGENEADDDVDDLEWDGLEPVDIDERSELLYHIFNHTCLSGYQTTILSGRTAFSPTLYRIMNYQPPIPSRRRKPKDAPSTHHEILEEQRREEFRTQYTEWCGRILKLLGDSGLEFEALGKGLVEVWAGMVRHFSALVLTSAKYDEQSGYEDDEYKLRYEEIAILQNVLDLLSSSTYLFPGLIPFILDSDSGMGQGGIIACIRQLVSDVLSEPEKVEALDKMMMREHIQQEEDEEDDEEGENQDRDAKEKEKEERAEQKEGLKGWELELSDSVVRLCEALCWFGEQNSVWQGDELVDIILGLINTNLDLYVVKRGIDLFAAGSIRANHFQALINSSAKYPTQNAGESPLIDQLGWYLINGHDAAQPHEKHEMNITIVRGLAMMSASVPDAPILMAARTNLTACLTILLYGESNKIWGVHLEEVVIEEVLRLLRPSLALLHHLAYPFAPFSSQTKPASVTQSQRSTLTPGRIRPSQLDPDSIIGVDLVERLRTLNMQKEFNGLQHMFISGMGCMAYGIFDQGIGAVEGADGSVAEEDLRVIQAMGGDLLEIVVPGPEGDQVYEMFVQDDPPDEDVRAHVAPGEDIDMIDDEQLERGDNGREEVEDEVDEDVYRNMAVDDDSREVIVVSDDD
ncbi:hypothetical protein I350_06564 [Cryptococcus amylolentus CBS 6273]|uniref:Uncharacterized protein n=1 Tax=Cryptococcus amylolentus CBS 6273 TaxID=1296118 RepID=A0A1E3JM53_9TREE|nr:hypothetical protein I350_06564 [Cryptococcus amylolentus CBS 6273]